MARPLLTISVVVLEDYRLKRNFKRTREPHGQRDDSPGQSGLRFVVQKHAARRLHYDFRLEQGGVLKSWAVAKGPSLDPAVKRLAVMVEDHPLDYGGFEGVIADGNYGAGEVIVWDSGVYAPDDGRAPLEVNRAEADRIIRDGIETGKLSFTLYGRKMQGSWTLVRTAKSPKDWLLIKHRDRYSSADLDILADERSVASGLTIQDLKNGHLPSRTGALPQHIQDQTDDNARQAPLPSSLSPMLAGTASAAFSNPDWLFEPKLDGYRIIALVGDGQVKLLSRRGLDYTGNFPSVANGLRLQQGQLALDGEVVALDEQGRPDFGLLQRFMDRELARDEAVIRYYVFDLLHLNGLNLERAPLFARKALLAQTLIPGPVVRLVDSVEGEGERLLQAVASLGLEGIIAKRRNSTYQPGKRSDTWLKIKRVQEDDFVIGGWTEGKGVRGASFGALLLGQYQDRRLVFTGRVGGGFDEKKLREILAQLAPLEQDTSPFAGPVDLEGARAHWAKPELVARVRFAQWTVDGRLRAPVFIALRTDVAPADITKEEAVMTPPPAPARNRRSPQLEANDVNGILEQLESAVNEMTLQVQGHRIALSNLDKELWPPHEGQEAVKKRDLVRYYVRMAPIMLPHLVDRPITLTRYPDGIAGGTFYQKHWSGRKPSYVDTVRVFSSHNEGDVDFLLANNLPTLISFAQQAALEVHPWNSRVRPGPDGRRLPTKFEGSLEAVESSVLNYPDFVVFDLDPYIYSGKEAKGAEPELNRKAFLKTVEIARALKAMLDQLSLSSFIKTSGRTGLHIYVPVLRQYDYGVVRKACETIGQFLMRQFPKDLTMEWAVSKRTGRVFLDHNQNVRGKNMAAAYSPRAAPGAPVSTPVRWDELDDIYPSQFTMHNVPERVAGMGDLWKDILNAKHGLKALVEPEKRAA
ncbi:MAG: non-homologous end-joining DNA ligase [Dehalococcoidia bacterium]